MWCAYSFAALAFVGLPSAASSKSPGAPVPWISPTFLQPVLLPVIIAGQNGLAAAAGKRAEATNNDAGAVLYEVVKDQEHLRVQDAIAQQLISGAAHGDQAWRPRFSRGPRRRVVSPW